MQCESLIEGSGANKASAAKVNPLALAYLGLSVILCVVGQLFLKIGVKNMNSFTGIISLQSHLIGMVNFSVIVGLILYFTATLFWLLALSRMDLSFAYPVASIQYVLVFLGAWYFFDEMANWLRLAGMALICLGVGIMYIGEKKC